jgi:hypothetical protein
LGRLLVGVDPREEGAPLDGFEREEGDHENLLVGSVEEEPLAPTAESAGRVQELTFLDLL